VCIKEKVMKAGKTGAPNKYAKLIAKAWADPSFKATLVRDPRAAMATVGIKVPDGVKVKVVEDNATTVHLVIPEKPSDRELSDIDLNKLMFAYESNSSGAGSLC
jgi:hypothetical protein